MHCTQMCIIESHLICNGYVQQGRKVSLTDTVIWAPDNYDLRTYVHVCSSLSILNMRDSNCKASYCLKDLPLMCASHLVHTLPFGCLHVHMCVWIAWLASVSSVYILCCMDIN